MSERIREVFVLKVCGGNKSSAPCVSQPEDAMPRTATEKIRKIGDECFLPLDEEVLAYLLARAGTEVELTLENDRVVVTRHSGK